MIVKAKKKDCKKLTDLTKEFHQSLFAPDYDEVYEELITEESANFLAATAWPFLCYKTNHLDFLVNSTLNPNPETPIHDALSLAFQMDIQECRSGLFRGFADGLKHHQQHLFNEDTAIAFIDGKSAILAADTPSFPLFMMFTKQKNGKYLIDFLSLWLFSMEMKASILWDIASHAQKHGSDEYATVYFKLATSLEKSYVRINRLICQHPIIGQYIRPERKHEIGRQLEIAKKANDKLHLLAGTQQKYISLEKYEQILEITTNMAIVMERSPEAFAKLGEEDIRQHFLVQLNGHFKGSATGETFNYSGKTDILIRHDNMNVFVAECKFWRGESTFIKTIDQILNYATWRDTWLAIFIFNKNRNLSDVLQKIEETCLKHPAFLRKVNYPIETGFRYYLKHQHDPKRELLMTVLVFDIPELP